MSNHHRQLVLLQAARAIAALRRLPALGLRGHRPAAVALPKAAA